MLLLYSKFEICFSLVNDLQEKLKLNWWEISRSHFNNIKNSYWRQHALRITLNPIYTSIILDEVNEFNKWTPMVQFLEEKIFLAQSENMRSVGSSFIFVLLTAKFNECVYIKSAQTKEK